METLQVGKLKIKIECDDFPLNPRDEFENVGTIACWHGRYNLGDVQPSGSPEDYLLRLMQSREWKLYYKEVPDDIKSEHIKAYINKHFFILPVYMYEHSSVALKTTPFACPWDSGQLGFIYASRNSKGYTDMLAGLEAEVRTYSQYLSGEVYGFEIVDEDGEIVDACSGFYGYEDCKAEALHIAQAYV